MIIIPGKKKNLSARYYSNILDYLIVLIVSAIYIFLAGDADEFGTYHVKGFKALVLPLIWFVYFPVCEASWGQTIGKKAFHLHVVDVRGNVPTIVQTFLRRLLDSFEMMFLGIPALLVINQSDKNQRIGDMMAGTTVVRVDAICRLCGSELELSPKEVIKDVFVCPICEELN
ncbi:MAG: RDD family protein [Bacteroidetes bacterium]|nr:RDD family protein [Bacteroidota bacterium]